ncbi:MAG: GNAT family N-acetyltransferase [Chloroflexota bacterium]|nr:GNAT family N-acetyltransferase [Chloroflexota bacterium]MDE2969202.1 GNAT family N-acetyltransferase [Chloroflexota bacterium]
MGDIREATADDANAVFGLLTLLAVSYQPSRAAFDRTYPMLIASPSAHFLVAEDEEGVQGYVYACDMPTLFANGTITEILELYVVESRRRQGIGASLVNAVVARARERDAVEVTVPTRRASAFYEAIGFEQTAQLLKLRLVG